MIDLTDISYSYPTEAKDRLDRLKNSAGSEESQLFSANAPSFKDLLDVINPLQQLPIVGSIYRSLSGDTLSTGARLAGGALLGGPLGFLSAAFNAGLEAATGKDLGEQVIAMMTDDESDQQYAMNAYQKADDLLS